MGSAAVFNFCTQVKCVELPARSLGNAKDSEGDVFSDIASLICFGK